MTTPRFRQRWSCLKRDVGAASVAGSAAAGRAGIAAAALQACTSDNGYVLLHNRRTFAASPTLKTLLEPFDDVRQGLHLTGMDGPGPSDS